MYSSGFSQIIEMLPEYLSSQGIDASKKFCCPHPEHNDKTPSASLFKNRLVKCFGCGRAMTIFDMAHILEGLPKKGDPGFFEQNIAILAQRYGVALPKWSESKSPSIYSSIISFITETYIPAKIAPGESKEDLLNSRLPNKKFKELQDILPVCVPMPPLQMLVDHLVEEGFSAMQIREAGLQEYIFPEEECLSYPLWLSHSVCVGFINKNPTGNPKYMHTPKNSCFDKKKYLYGMFLAPDSNKPLYIVEGQKDCLATWVFGYQSVAPMTSHLSNEQVDLLVNRGFRNIIMCFDSDDAGRNGTIDAIEKLLSQGIMCQVCVLPEEKDDPYKYLIDDDKKVFPEPLSGFQVYIDYLLKQGDGHTASGKVIDILSNITSRVRRELLAKEFASFMSITPEALVSDVEELVAKKKEAKNNSVITVLERGLEKAKGNPEHALNLMSNAYQYAQEIVSQKQSFNNDFLIAKVRGVKNGVANNAHKDIHFRKNGLGILSDYFHVNGVGWTEGSLGAVGGDPHTGKCHRKGTKILMFDGTIKKVEDMIVGDKIMGPDSKPREILSLAKGKDKITIVNPNYGESWGCNQAHILSLYCNRDKTPGFEKGKTYNVSIQNYKQLTETQKHGLKLWRVAVDFEKQNLPYEPYLIGLWIGNGSRHKPAITNMNKEVVDYIENFAEAHNYKVTKETKEGDKASTYSLVTARGKPNPLGKYFKSILVDNEKRIPKRYLINSKENRNLLLAGLVDSDGYKDGCGYEICTKWEGLKEDILYLARSLGHRATSSIKEVDGKKYYRICITGYLDEVPVLIDYKKIYAEDKSKKHRHPLRTGFVLEDVGEEEFYGFSVDKDNLYLLWDFTVTHNSALSLQMMVETLLFKQNTMAIHLSTDDAVDLLLPRVMSASVFEPDFYINHTLNPDVTGYRKTARDGVIKKVSEWANSERLIMKDQNFSNKFSRLSDLVRYYRDKYPERQILVFNDNFHRCGDYRDKDKLTRQEFLANDAKELCIKEKVSLWLTVEYRKNKESNSNRRRSGPVSADIKGDGALTYHASFIINLHNDFIEQNGNIDSSSHVHSHNGELLPRVDVNISKNKISGNLGAIPMNLFPKSSFFQPVDKDIAMKEAAERSKAFEE